MAPLESSKQPEWSAKHLAFSALVALLWTEWEWVSLNELVLQISYFVFLIAPPLSDWHMDVDARLQFGVTYGKLSGFIQPDDPVILVSGWRPGSGNINSIRLIYASGESERPKKEQKPVIQEPVFNDSTNPENVSVAESEDLSMPNSLGFSSEQGADDWQMALYSLHCIRLFGKR